MGPLTKMSSRKSKTVKYTNHKVDDKTLGEKHPTAVLRVQQVNSVQRPVHSTAVHVSHPHQQGKRGVLRARGVFLLGTKTTAPLSQPLLSLSAPKPSAPPTAVPRTAPIRAHVPRHHHIHDGVHRRAAARRAVARHPWMAGGAVAE